VIDDEGFIFALPPLLIEETKRRTTSPTRYARQRIRLNNWSAPFCRQLFRRARRRRRRPPPCRGADLAHWARLQDALIVASFWARDPEERRLGLDGLDWLIEGAARTSSEP